MGVDVAPAEVEADEGAAALLKLLGELLATFGLLTVIFGAGRPDRAAVAVAGYIGAAYWFTSSTSFANPAVTLARTLSDSFAGIAPTSAPAFVAAQLAGALLAVGAAQILFNPEEAHDARPRLPQPRPAARPANGGEDPAQRLPGHLLD